MDTEERAEPRLGERERDGIGSDVSARLRWTILAVPFARGQRRPVWSRRRVLKTGSRGRLHSRWRRPRSCLYNRLASGTTTITRRMSDHVYDYPPLRPAVARIALRARRQRSRRGQLQEVHRVGRCEAERRAPGVPEELRQADEGEGGRLGLLHRRRRPQVVQERLAEDMGHHEQALAQQDVRPSRAPSTWSSGSRGPRSSAGRS